MKHLLCIHFSSLERQKNAHCHCDITPFGGLLVFFIDASHVAGITKVFYIYFKSDKNL